MCSVVGPDDTAVVHKEGRLVLWRAVGQDPLHQAEICPRHVMHRLGDISI